MVGTDGTGRVCVCVVLVGRGGEYVGCRPRGREDSRYVSTLWMDGGILWGWGGEPARSSLLDGRHVSIHSHTLLLPTVDPLYEARNFVTLCVDLNCLARESPPLETNV